MGPKEKKMLILFDLDDTLFRRLPDEYTDEEVNALRLFPGAREILSRTDIDKVLVSRGTYDFQMRKIDVLGIRDLFDEIFICAIAEEKKELFQQAAAEFRATDVWVVGDRPDTEIRYGNELGFTTVLVRGGKYNGIVPQEESDVPDYVITTFSELQGLLPEASS